jgi:hypothetical protein
MRGGESAKNLVRASWQMIGGSNDIPFSLFDGPSQIARYHKAHDVKNCTLTKVREKRKSAGGLGGNYETLRILAYRSISFSLYILGEYQTTSHKEDCQWTS